MRFWRIYNIRYAVPLSGEGARLYGGRWNPKGMSLLYLADSPALAMLEILARAPNFQQTRNYRAAEVEIDARHLPSFPPRSLPPGWDAEPASDASQLFGQAQFTVHGRLGFSVPSVAVPLQQNAVLLIGHEEFRDAIRLVRDDIPCPFDRRLVQD